MEKKIKRGIVAKFQIEKAGLNWNDVSKKLIKNGWAHEVSSTQLRLNINLKREHGRLLETFGDNSSEILPILQYAQRKSEWQEWGEALIVAAILAIFVRTFLVQIYKIPSGSMIPTLMPGDKLLANKLIYGPKIPFTSFHLPAIRQPERYDVVIFVPPQEMERPWLGRKPYIKRLIGLSGERVLIKNGNIYINGKKLSDPRINWIKYSNATPYGEENREIVVPQGKYFFLGDNTNNSLDSRFWGFADKENILGKAIFIWWPPKRITIIK